MQCMQALTQFLNIVKNNLGDFVCIPKWFMSDMARLQYFSAWKIIFGEDPRKLLCIWHVDRAHWQSNLSLITDIEKRTLVYKQQLCVILEEPKEDVAIELQFLHLHIRLNGLEMDAPDGIAEDYVSALHGKTQ